MESPTPYIRSTQRLSEGYAARVAERLWPNESVRRQVCNFLAEFLVRGGRGTTAWSVTLDPDSIRVNIGPVQLLRLWSDQIWFCSLDPLSCTLPHWVRDVSHQSIVYPKSVGVPSRQYAVDPNRIAHLPEEFRSSALRYVDEAASRRKGKSAWAGSHSDGVILFLESSLGIKLPRPRGGEETQLGMSSPFLDSEPLEIAGPYGFRGPESAAHKALKGLIFTSPEVLGLNAKYIFKEIEHCLPSGDSIDVYFEARDLWIAVEVKAARVPDREIQRGLFQCVKYKALLRAVAGVQHLEIQPEAILALGGKLPVRLREVRKTPRYCDCGGSR